MGPSPKLSAARIDTRNPTPVTARYARNAAAAVHHTRAFIAARSEGASTCAARAETGTGMAASASATAAGPRNARRSSTAPARPPHNGADTTPAVCTAANVPMLRPSDASSADSASAASSSGVVNALQIPCAARAATNGPSAVTNAATTETAA